MWSNSISPEPYQSVPRPIRIAHVGAGTAGLITAYKLLPSYELVGGTRLGNRLDIPESDAMFRRIPITSHLSQTRGWNGYYLSGDQLQEYFVNFAEEYDLEHFIKFETKVGLSTSENGRRLKVFRPTRGSSPTLQTGIRILTGRTNVSHLLGSGQAVSKSFQGWSKDASASSMVDRNGRLLLVDCVRSIHAMDNPSSCMARSADDPEKSAMPAPAGKHFYTEERKISSGRTQRSSSTFPWLVVDRRLEKTSWKLSLKTTPESYLAKSAGSQKQESK
ncbi:hypothetical protein DTO207G8_5009 [Paecilomyces variotii]|nr:hypothetical protein DTO207G8_5009 [Paecilomyces variotii]